MRRIISGSSDKTIIVWDLDLETCEYKETKKLIGHSDSVLSVALYNNGR